MSEPTPTPAPTPQPAPKPMNPLLKNGLLIGLGIGIALGWATLGGAEWGIWKWWNKPPVPVNAAITLDVSQNPQVGHRITIHATTAGKTVKWLQLSGPVMLGPDQLWTEADPHDCGLTTDTKGDYVIEGITVVSGAPEFDQIHVLVGVGPTPPSPPGPGPNPPGPTPGPIPAGQLRVLMTYDKDVPLAQGQLDVIKSAATQKLVPAGNWKVYSTTQTFGDELPIWKSVFEKRKNPVGIVIFNGQDGSIVYEGPLPNGMAEATALVKKFGG